MTNLNGWKTSDGSYQVLSNDFINTGGNQMVLVVTVYDFAACTTQYVIVNEEACRLYTANFIELDIEYNDDMRVAYYDKAYQYAIESETLVVLDGQLNELFDRCWRQYLVEYCEQFNYVWHMPVENLPTALRHQMPVGYKEWLDERNQLVATNGKDIIIDKLFTPVITGCEPRYIKDLMQLKDYMIHSFDSAETQEEFDDFYNMKANISFGNMVVTLDNTSTVYEALMKAIDDIVSQE